MKKLYGEYFFGNKASDYAIENGYLDYRTLAKSFDAVMSNNIIESTYDIGYWEQINGYIDNSEEIEELQDKINELEELNENGINDDEIKELEDKICELEYENERDIFQYFIISSYGAEILEDYTDEIVFYNETLDMYVWGVTHYGTSWDYVLTDIKLNCGEEAFAD